MESETGVLGIWGVGGGGFLGIFLGGVFSKGERGGAVNLHRVVICTRM